MSFDLVQAIVDIICTIWEGIMSAYLVRAYVNRKISFKNDFIWIILFLLFVESLTFLSVPSFIKLLIEWIVFSLIIFGIYRTSLLDGLLTFSTFVLIISITEAILTTFLGLFLPDLENGKVISRVEYYLIYHVFMTLLTLGMRRVLKKVSRNLTNREKILFIVLFTTFILILVSIVNRSLFGWDVVNQVFQIAGLIVLLVILFLLIFFVNDSARVRMIQQEEENELKKLQTQYQYYEERIKEEERVRRVYHDMKNHLLVIQAQLEDFENTDNRSENEERKHETEKMIQSLQHQIADYENYVQTGNAFLDVILRDKLKKAKEKNIDFHTEIDFTNGDFIDALDVSTIFGNALDNAIEACEKVSEEKRFITMKVRTKNNFLVIYLENSAVWEKMESTTTKEDVFLHGYGLKNIQWAVEKYGGQCKRDFQNDMYILSILLPITLK